MTRKKMFRKMILLLYLTIPIISYFYIFNTFNLEKATQTLELVITSYIIIVGFFIGFYPKEIIRFNEYVDSELKTTLLKKVNELTPVFRKLQREYSYPQQPIKPKRETQHERVITDPKYFDFFEKITNMYFVYVGMVVFFIFMIVFYLVFDSIYDYNNMLFYFMFYYTLLIYFYVIIMMFLTILALQTNKYIIRSLFEGVFLEKNFWQDMLTGFDIISEIPDTKTKKMYLKALGIEDINKKFGEVKKRRK